MNALSAMNTDFTYPENFPKFSNEIRKRLGEHLPRIGIDISQNTIPLLGGEMYNLVSRIPNLTILADEGFTVNSQINNAEKADIIDRSDWIIKVAHNHYVSFVKKSKDTRLLLDSLNDKYTEMSDTALKSLLSQTDQKNFMAMQVYHPKSSIKVTKK
jgi:hypothetical protein